MVKLNKPEFAFFYNYFCFCFTYLVISAAVVQILRTIIHVQTKQKRVIETF